MALHIVLGIAAPFSRHIIWTISKELSSSKLPSPMCSISHNVYYRASDVSRSAMDALRSNARKANVILPTLEKTLARELAGQFQGEQVWITCSYDSDVKFVLAITQGYMGPYPAFIFTTIPFHELSDQHIRPFIVTLVNALVREVPMRRI